MPLMLSSLYDALVEAGASDEAARKAAEEGAQYESRFGTIESRLARIERHLEGLNHRMNVLMAVIFVVLGGVLSTLWVLARH